MAEDKTFLIKQMFARQDCFFFNVTGVQNGKMDIQINRFTKEIGNVFYQGADIKEQANWIATFDMLSNAIEKIVPPNKKVVLFFDEFPWMATHKSGLLQALEHRWNHSWSHDNRIDLLFDRDDDTITICEIKYTTEPFAITKDYAEKLRNKISVFREKTRTRKQIFLVLISANGIKKTIYSEELVQSIVTLKDLFI